jgi:hypothetical protein
MRCTQCMHLERPADLHPLIILQGERMIITLCTSRCMPWTVCPPTGPVLATHTGQCSPCASTRRGSRLHTWRLRAGVVSPHGDRLLHPQPLPLRRTSLGALISSRTHTSGLGTASPVLPSRSCWAGLTPRTLLLFGSGVKSRLGNGCFPRSEPVSLHECDRST